MPLLGQHRHHPKRVAIGGTGILLGPAVSRHGKGAVLKEREDKLQGPPVRLGAGEALADQ